MLTNQADIQVNLEEAVKMDSVESCSEIPWIPPKSKMCCFGETSKSKLYHDSIQPNNPSTPVTPPFKATAQKTHN